MHSLAYAAPAADLSDFGLYRFRKGAELHSTSPEFVRRMHAHIRKSGPETYSAFEELSKSSGSIFLRDQLEMVAGAARPARRSGTARLHPQAL